MDPNFPSPFPSYPSNNPTSSGILPYPSSTSYNPPSSPFGNPNGNGNGLGVGLASNPQTYPAPFPSGPDGLPALPSSLPPARKKIKPDPSSTLPAAFTNYPLPALPSSSVAYPPTRPAADWRERNTAGLGVGEDARRIQRLMQGSGAGRGGGAGGFAGVRGMNGGVKAEDSKPAIIDLSDDDTKPTPFSQQKSGPIDLTMDDPLPPLPKQESKPSASGGGIDRKPICIGSIDSMALIMYPSPWIAKGHNIAELLSKHELRLTTPSQTPSYPATSTPSSEPEEWLKVKLKYKKVYNPQKGKDESAINVMNANQTVHLGVLSDGLMGVLGQLMERGLLRLEGWVKRGNLDKMFTAAINVLLFTLPSNIAYISQSLLTNSFFLDHPLPTYDGTYHSDHPIYQNPHNPPPGGFRANRKLKADALLAQGKRVETGKTVEVQREQVDQVFRSLKGEGDLVETHGGAFIKTDLFPHQRKALTFLLQREGEESAVKAALKAAVAAAKKEIDARQDSDLDASEDELEEKRASALKKKKKDLKRRGINSLWEPVEDISSRSGGERQWKNLVTEEVRTSKGKPEEARGAILADDMGLGKTLSVVSLIATTLKTARKFGRGKGRKRDESSDEDESEEEEEGENGGEEDGEGGEGEGSLSPGHFAGSVFGMPDAKPANGAAGKKGKVGGKKREKERAKAKSQEQKARATRISARSRATLLVCPLSTVTNWEEQIKEHWNGQVMVVGGAGIAPSQAELVDAGPDVLKIYVYHGNSRRSHVPFIADFDIVITTFSVLQTEFSKQVKSVAPSTEVSSAAPSPPEDEAGSDADEVMVVDEDGLPEVKDERPDVALERRVMEQEEKMAKRKRKRGDCSELYGALTPGEQISPLQAIEWFRVVLDEAHFIKDSTTVVSRAACYLEAQRRIALTGTPIQNKIDDVWALLKFLRLTPFDEKDIWQKYILSLAKSGNSVGVARLQTVLKHCTLRRTKETKHDNGKSILDLPPRKDELREIIFTPEERAIYQKYHDQTKLELDALTGENQKNEIDPLTGENKKPEVKGSLVNMLHHILRLRQICDHWTLVNDSNGIEEIEDELLDDGLMDVDTAFENIRTEGLTFRRALSAVQCLKAQERLLCSQCNFAFELPQIPVPGEEDALGGEVKPKPRRGKAAKCSPFPIVTRCCHVYCLGCLKQTTGQTNWPKIASNINRMCAVCSTGLRMLQDVIEVGPAGQTLQTASTGGRNKSARNLMKSGPVLMSAKMRSLLMDLRAFSVANPNSDNYDPMSSEAELSDLDDQGKILTTKTVVFSQWTTMLDHIEDMLEESNIKYARLDGTMKREERADAMDRLKNDAKTEVLLVSLRAGGVGLNLTTATRCYLIDPYWNPSVENQAIDRIHRLGQKRNVTSVKFVVKDSIEENMLKVQKRKAELAALSLSQTISKKDLHERRLEDLKLLFS